MNKKGVGVLELLVSMTLASLIMALSLSGFKSLFSRMEMSHAIRTVTAALNTARYQAIENNRPVKVENQEEGIVLKIKGGDRWIPLQVFEWNRRTEISMTASPVFSPFGSVTPTTTIELRNHQRLYEITAAITGRIKVFRIR
jgi:Tfp pilus assembly protein FimT